MEELPSSFTYLGDKMIYMENYDSFKHVPLLMVDQICEMMVQLELSQSILADQLGVKANLTPSTAAIFKEFEFGEKTKENSHFLLLKDGNELIGFLVYRFYSKSEVMISSLFVAEKYRRQGHGKDLLLQAIEDIKVKFPSCSIEVGVVSNNLPALLLYRSVGFNVTTHLTLMCQK